MTDTTQTTETTAETETSSGVQTQTPNSGTETGTTTSGAGAEKTTGKATKTTSAGARDDKPWFDGLPDDLKGQGHVTRHASVEDAVRALIGAEKRLGVPADQLLRLPTKPEERAELYGKLGAPETAEGYKIALPENATDEDKAVAKSFAEHMHKNGPFPPDFVAAALEWNNQMTEAGQKAEADAAADRRAAGEQLLKDTLKANYDPEMKAVGKLLNDLGGEELAAEFDLTGHGDNPRLMLALHKVIERLGEPQTLDGGNGGTGVAKQITAGQAKAARETLENDPIRSKALWDNSHSMHKTVVEERARLIKIEEGLDPDA